MKLTEHFSVEEFERSSTAKKYKIENKIPEHLYNNLQALAELLEKIREVWNAPIQINSGYRSPELNKKVGGAKNSDHVYAAAADITVGTKNLNKELFRTIISIPGLQWRQLIDESDYTWVHISINHDKNNYKNNQILKL